MKKAHLYILLAIIILIVIALIFIPNFISQSVSLNVGEDNVLATSTPPAPVLDKALYDKKIFELANNPIAKPAGTSSKATSSPIIIATTTSTTTKFLWPVKTVYPNFGALLPFNRIVAYYGNFYSTKMGVLGEYPPAQMKQMLLAEVAKWQNADPETPVIPAIHYIAVSAQGSSGKDGMYRLRMPDDQIAKAINLAKEVNGITILDIQLGKSNVETEVPLLEKFLKLPNVHLALDPEFSMATSGKKPGTVIGTMDAKDINFAADFLAKIVRENNLPPKILIIHRFTQNMVTNSSLILPLPEVQIVMDMDGWGGKPNKIKAYKDVIYPYPVEFAGFKLFYKNDLLPPSKGMLTPAEVLNLSPKPIYIQYQ